MKHVINLDLEKETKNTFRYQEKPEEGKPPIIWTLYIQKWAVSSAAPQKIQVTIEAEEEA